MKRDESVISRQIKSIASLAPVLEKNGKRWQLSALGKRLVHWSIEAMQSQEQLLNEQVSLTIATTYEFSAKVLCPGILSLMGKEKVLISVLTSDEGIEEDLISGRADVGIDCQRPQNPLIRFKTVLPEPYIIVASPAFLKRYNVRSKEDLLLTPHLKFNRDPALGLLQLGGDIPNIAGIFNALSSIRAACCVGLGWTALPLYCVRTELTSGLLEQIDGWKLEERSFGVWWVRGREKNSPWIVRTIDWLKQQRL